MCFLIKGRKKVVEIRDSMKGMLIRVTGEVAAGVTDHTDDCMSV